MDKIALDRWLTTLPDDGFTSYCEEVDDNFSDQFFDTSEDWILEYDGQCNKWLNKCFYKKDYSPKFAAQLIERAKRLYKA